MRRLTCFLSAFSLLGAIASAQNGNGTDGNNGNNDNLQKVEHRINDHGAKASSASSTPLPIMYHNGPVILGGTHVYYIWYGGWNNAKSAGYDPNALSILNTLASNLSGSTYFNINTTYYSVSGTSTSYVNGVVTLINGGTPYYDAYSQGTNLNDRAVANIVSRFINATQGGHPDANGVYFVLASKDVNETSGFCTQYCGWHTYGTMSGTYVKYAFIGNPARCINSCSMFGSGGGMTAPNGDPGADGMASILTHELEEATTDPQLNAWYDSSGAENADKCAWTFGTVTNNSYNISFGGLNYLIQQNWMAGSNQHCTMSVNQ